MVSVEDIGRSWSTADASVLVFVVGDIADEEKQEYSVELEVKHEI
jgi:hypothetical protein